MSTPSPETKPLLVAGGGIAGITTALRARAEGLDVVLVEQQAALGGLLASYRPAGSDCVFDQGTHIPAATGEPSLDTALFGKLSPARWQTFSRLRAGTFWNGQLGDQSPCLDLRTLPASDYQSVLPGLLQPAASPSDTAPSLSTQIDNVYGPAMRHCVFEPLLRKFCGLGSEALAPDAHLLFGLKRFICLDSSSVRELKRDPWLDAKLAYHDHVESTLPMGEAHAYYPREGGVGQWVEQLAAQLAATGVEILAGTSVRSVDLVANRATLADGRVIEFGRLAWSLPAGLLLRAGGHAATANLPAPRLASISLYHFVTDRPASSEAHYVTCYDQAKRSFRVTQYDNLQPGAHGHSRVTVEVIRPTQGMALCAPSDIFRELTEMQLLAPGTNVLECHTQEIAAGFPVQTPAYRWQMLHTASLAQEEFPGVVLIGRAAGRTFFMKEVLLEAWNAAGNLAGDARISRGGRDRLDDARVNAA